MSKRVTVLGGGVAGLSAAHELVKRGYKVTVVEARPDLGGKARSQRVAATGKAGRADLPGEHGFRFYPAFYKHLIQTMSEIPLESSAKRGPTVVDNLRPCRQAGIAVEGLGLQPFMRHAPQGALDVVRTLDLFFGQLRVSPLDMARFATKVLRYLSSCRKRRAEQYENVSWWDYLGGSTYDRSFQRYLRAVPRIMVAMDPQRGSARTIGNISMQLMADYGQSGGHNDRTLVGPTTEAWIAPWQRHLASQGVTFHLGKGVIGLDFDEETCRITGARVDGEASPLRSDHYVLAVPLEVAVTLVTDEMADSDRELAKLKRVRDGGLADASTVTPGGSNKLIDWMVGIQFYLREDVKLVEGHVFYPDSPWALSSISQAQFWDSQGGLFRERFGDGEAGGVLSVDVSDWNREGVLFKKPAKLCTREEIRREIWEQLKRGLNLSGGMLLRDELLLRWNLDQDIEFPSEDRPVNRSPLLVHPPGSWHLRPEAETGVENLVLASDYVRTETNLACMEGANEAARRAVNAILRQDGYPGAVCQLWDLEEDSMFDRAKWLDNIAYTKGRPAVAEAIGSFMPRSRAIGGDDELTDFFMGEREDGIRALAPDRDTLDLDDLRVLQEQLTGAAPMP